MYFEEGRGMTARHRLNALAGRAAASCARDATKETMCILVVKGLLCAVSADLNCNM